MDPKETMIYVVVALVIVVLIVAGADIYAGGSGKPNIAVSISVIGPKVSYPLDTAMVVVNIRNIGSRTVSGLPVDLYQNSKLLNPYTVSIPAKKNATIVYNISYSTSGSYVFQVQADPSKTMGLENYSTAMADVIVNVTPAQSPNVYSSIPNNGTETTYAFTLASAGSYLAYFTGIKYNLSIGREMLGPAYNQVGSVFANLWSAINTVNGAYSTYKNGTVAHVLWIEGGFGPSAVDYIVSTFGSEGKAEQLRGLNVTEFTFGKNTSMCVFYENGWTKVETYQNNSLGGSCLSFVVANYTPTVSNTFVALLKGNATLADFKSKFFYTNSTAIGYSLWRGNGTFGFANIAQDTYGSFISSVEQFSKNLTGVGGTGKCMGLLYSYNGVSICSVYVLPALGNNLTANFSVVNTTEVTPTYRIGLYSIVNTSSVVAAHYNALHLLESLGINQTSFGWQNAFQNSCSLNNDSLPCSVQNFNYSTNAALVNITNGLGQPIKVNSAECYMPGERLNTTYNGTIAAHSSNTIQVPCYNVPVPLASSVYSYIFVMNYTTNNAHKLAVGYLNITNYPTET
jgi:hypothetical protein